MIVLRDYQTKMIENIRGSFQSGHKHIICQMEVGAGKTIIATEIIRMAIEKRKKVLFLAPRRQLIYQTVDALKSFNIQCGTIMAGEMPFSQPLIQVASFDTITARVGSGKMKLPAADLVIADEGHMLMSPARLKILEQYPRVLGLTATPALANGKGMGSFYTDIIEGLTMSEMVSQGHLVKMRYFIGEAPDLSNAKLNKDGEYTERTLEDANDKKALIGAVYDNWKRIAGDRCTLVFAVNRKHARHLHDEFISHGVTCEYIDGDTESEEREAIKKRVMSGSTQVIVNIGVMVAGVSWDKIDCIVMARQTKSINTWRQCLGRGSRTFSGKSDCLARDTLILTDKGLVKIQHVTLYHRLWDGVSWVKHEGAVCKGIQDTIEYSGLSATLDHKVMTNEGWKEFSEAANRQLRIIDSGIGWSPVRVSKDNFTKNRRKARQANGGGFLSALWRGVYDSISQYTEKEEPEALPGMQSTEKNKIPALAIPAMPGANESLYKQKSSRIQNIWRSWNRVQIQIAKCSSGMGSKKPRNSRARQEYSARQDRQQWALRAWEFTLGYAGSESGQYQTFGWFKKESVYRVQEIISKYKICRLNIKQFDGSWLYGRGNNRQVQKAFKQTKREVWDIHSAGSLQRFTANGKLVHNCLIIYHGDNFDELGAMEDDIEWSLDDKQTVKERQQKEREEKAAPKDIKCKECGSVYRSRRDCPACGFESIPHGEDIPYHKADLQEIKPDKVKPCDKEKFYSQLLFIAKEKGYKRGWADFKFKEKFSHFPAKKNGVIPIPPTKEVTGFLQHLNIKRAKSKH